MGPVPDTANSNPKQLKGTDQWSPRLDSRPVANPMSSDRGMAGPTAGEGDNGAELKHFQGEPRAASRSLPQHSYADAKQSSSTRIDSARPWVTTVSHTSVLDDLASRYEPSNRQYSGQVVSPSIASSGSIARAEATLSPGTSTFPIEKETDFGPNEAGPPSPPTLASLRRKSTRKRKSPVHSRTPSGGSTISHGRMASGGSLPSRDRKLSGGAAPAGPRGPRGSLPKIARPVPFQSAIHEEPASYDSTTSPPAQTTSFNANMFRRAPHEPQRNLEGSEEVMSDAANSSASIAPAIPPLQSATPLFVDPWARPSSHVLSPTQLSGASESLINTPLTGGSSVMGSSGTASPASRKPRGPRLSVNTLTSPKLHSQQLPTPVSPGLKHWQQVRQHILAPTPNDERAPGGLPYRQPGKKLKMVTKAAERFGFRNAAESVMGYDRRRSTYGAYRFGTDLSEEQREEASRERRRFARDIKVCLDGCAMEESNRRLNRMMPAGTTDMMPQDMMPPKSGAKSTKGKTHHSDPRTMNGYGNLAAYDQSGGLTSTFAPLLTELHRYIPEARAKRVWSRTCPHHAIILAELGVTFLTDSVSTDAERFQALEVFGTVVKNWSTDSADEELDRWLWLCRAMLVDDWQLRQRGLELLAKMVRRDPSLPHPLIRPMSADDFESFAIAVIRLLHALESSANPTVPHQDVVNAIIADLSHGDIIRIDTTTLVDLREAIEESEHVETLEREMLWMAAGRAIAIDQDVATWMLAGDASVLKRYSPAPILRATPPVIIRLRLLAANQFLASLSTVVRRTSNFDTVAAVADTADFIYEDTRDLVDNDTDLVGAYATVLLDIELKRNEASRPGSNDPFSSAAASEGSTSARDRLRSLLKNSRPGVMGHIAEQLVTSFPANRRMAAIRYFLESDLALLGRLCVPPLLQRLTPAHANNPTIRPFLSWLSERHPQLFYKPLFTLSAATQISSLRPPLNIVTTMTKLIGADRFWTRADPQMIVIVLMGGVAGTKANTKLVNGGEVQVKPGRYATMLELLLALKALPDDENPKRPLKTFLTTLETRLAAVLEVEERQGRLPNSYRSLVSQLFSVLRNASKWTKKTAATRLAVSWLARGKEEIPHWTSTLNPDDEDQVTVLRDLLSVEEKEFSVPRTEALDKPCMASLSALMVTIQASLSDSDGNVILPVLWERFASPSERNLQIAFLLTKCAELVPDAFRTLVMEELFSSPAGTISRTLLKLALLYGFRYQLLTQPTIADERGVFKFSGKVYEFVATEMGCSDWVVPRHLQDEALQKFGRSLPLELRQRLMELGWSDEGDLTAADYERVPVSLLPPTVALNTSAKDTKAPAPAPKPALQRSMSNSSNSGVRQRRPILPPILLSLINEQAPLLYESADVAAAIQSFELIRMVEREDAAALIRPIEDILPSNLTGVIARINADVMSPTPSFAFAAINTLAGYLKTSVRDDPQFRDWSRILSTIARLAPHVSEMSLRDIRKSKAEPVLLPGSIYEDGAGFKLHPPWQNDVLPIQTAQLILLIELLRANPRDVYLIKKLLFNLQVQASFTHLPFARAWLELVVELFSGLNSNYNDRAEFRHFLNNIAMVIALHGKDDIIVASQAMRAVSVCSARFRRVFASIGFVGIMRIVYETYVSAHATIRDCIEYTCRGIYRIHRDVFVYQLCLALAEDTHDPKAAFDLLASLSVANGPNSGAASGVRGLNERFEVDALVQMFSRSAEVTFSEIGATAEERRVQKAASLNLGPVTFPRENIIRLLVTVIAVNAASPRAIRLLRLFARLTPYMTDPKSKALLGDGIDAIGRFIHREKMGDDGDMHRFLPGEENAVPDWKTASREYVFLVDAAVKHGCTMSVHATRRLLDIVLNLLHSSTEGISPVASSVLGSLTRTHLAGQNPGEFLRDIAPTYRSTLATVDFSGVLESITDLIRRSQFDLQTHTANVIVQEYVGPVIRLLAFASEESMAFLVPVRSAAVELLAASVFLPGSATLDVLETVASSPGLLASVILPLVLLIDKPREVNRDEAYTSFWIRILRCVLRPSDSRPTRNAKTDTPLALASMSVLSLQIIKIIVIRAPECISAVPGLWPYISTELLRTMSDGDGRFYEMANEPLSMPRVVDWMMWSLFELLVHHRNPLHIDFRLRIQTVLAKTNSGYDQHSLSRRSSIASDGLRPSPLSPSPIRSLSGLIRRPSARVSPNDSSPVRSTGQEMSTPTRRGHERNFSDSSQHLSPRIPSHSRMRSVSSTSPSTLGSAVTPIRPSFAALSARRASRPTFDVFPNSQQPNKRFPSSAPVRALNLGPQGEKSAIVHLLGPATNLVSTTGTGVAVNVSQRDPTRSALRDIRFHHPDIVTGTNIAVATTMAVYGYDTDGEEAHLQIWSVSDALRAITDQTKILVEVEFRDVFNPPQMRANEALNTWTAIDAEKVDDREGSFYTAKEEEHSDKEESFGYSLQDSYNDTSFQTYKFGQSGGGAEERIEVPTLNISQHA